MANEKMQKLPNGKWEYLVDEENDLVVIADTAQEAERMAQAYFKGDKSAAKKRIARRDINKSRSSLI